MLSLLLTTNTKNGVPKGIRTPVTAVKGQCPRPLDDGDLEHYPSTYKIVDGGARRDRTADLLHAMQALSQLSYNPKIKTRSLMSYLKTVKWFLAFLSILISN